MDNLWLHRFTVVVAACTFLLVVAGSLVTSNDAALSVPDWPLSYGRLVPPLEGGIRYEFAHRALAALVAFLTITMAVWIERAEQRRWMRRLGWAAVAAVLSLILGSLGVDDDLRWRLVLSFGCVPAISVLYLRRQMPETARYLARLAGDTVAAAQVVRHIAGTGPATAPSHDRRDLQAVFANHARAIFGAALLWLLFDIVVYSGILFGPSLIAQGLGLAPTTFSLITSFVFVIPGALLGVALIDKIGRKQLQTWGFIGAAVMLGLFTTLHDAVAAMPAFGMLLFGLYSVLITAGPSTVAGAGILGVELSPTRIRTIGQSITVVGGRIGASISAFLFPLLFGVLGETGVIALLAGVSVLGAVCTMLLIPETAGRSLEEINADAEADLAPSGAD